MIPTPERPKKRLADLGKALDRLAQERNLQSKYLRQQFCQMLLCGALTAAVARGIIPLYLVKGGVHLEARLGIRARATKDIDIGLCAEAETLLDTFGAALDIGFGDFTFRRKGEVKAFESGARRMSIQVMYLGNNFGTVDVDLNTASHNSSIDDLGTIPFDALRAFGVNLPATFPCLGLADQIAQKIHALTEPLPEGRRNERFQDVYDVLAMSKLLDGDLTSLSERCARIFAERGRHPWPLTDFAFPEHWSEPLANLATKHGYDTSDVVEIERRFNSLLVDVAGATSLPSRAGAD